MIDRELPILVARILTRMKFVLSLLMSNKIP